MTEILIGEHTTEIMKISDKSHSEIRFYKLVVTQRHAQQIALAGLSHHTAPLVIQGRYCIYIDKPSHCVSSVERALRTANHFDTRYIGHVKIIIVFIQERHIVNIQPYHWLVYTRSYATHIYA